MRNLLAYPVTYDETADFLTDMAECELEQGKIGGTGPMLLGNAARIVRREEAIIAALTEIVAAMRSSADPVPERFIQMIEAAIPQNNELGCPK